MQKILILTSGSGSLIDICLTFGFFRETVHSVITDRDCGAVEVAGKYNINTKIIEEKDATKWSDLVLQYALENKIGFILSYSNLKILKGKILQSYRNKIFNSHFSLLPAFKGFFHKNEAMTDLPARQIFERTLAFGSLVTGNTIHVIEEQVDNGAPVLVGIMNLAYGGDPKVLRHELFEIECKTVLQLVDWISQGRVLVDANSKVYIKNARFDTVGFSPNLDRKEIQELKIGWNAGG